MAHFSWHDVRRGLAAVRWPLRLTRAGMFVENLWQVTWPLITICLLVSAVLMLGLQDSLLVELVWAAAVTAVLAGAVALIYAVLKFRFPTHAAALARLDATLPGRPLQALTDTQVIGDGDEASTAVWLVHQSRMADSAEKAAAVPANLRIAWRDPYAVRYMALLIFFVALIFGSIWRFDSLSGLAPETGYGNASGPVWEGWAESPKYTGRPTIYLNDVVEGELNLPVGTLLTLRLYGDVGDLTVAETVSGRMGELPPASALEQDFIVMHSGTVSVSGLGGRTWAVNILPDEAPSIEIMDDLEVDALGEMNLNFGANDDFGVEAGEARIALDIGAVDRQHGLRAEPDPRAPITVSLPLPITGDRRNFEESLVENFSEHPWANLPVTITLTALDAAEQQAKAHMSTVTLPGRRFFDPLAAAIIEQRRDLLWARKNTKRISQILRAVSHLPENVFRREIDQLRLRRVIKRMEILSSYGLTEEQQVGLAKNMWDLALSIEDGDLSDALERLRQVKERLNQAMRDGASESEIEKLMTELRRATKDYMQQLSRQAELEAEKNKGHSPSQDPNSMQMSQDDLQRMMDRIQSLMEQGRMAEAEQALTELQEMLENMRVTQNQNGQGGKSSGEQAIEDLGETLRDQQGLSDQVFRDLQEQFAPDAQADRKSGNKNGTGDPDQGAENGDQQKDDRQGEISGEESLADRQQQLRNELRRQEENIPDSNKPGDDSARDALDRAGRAMKNAEEALRQRDFADAIDKQSQALEALRDGMRALSKEFEQEQQSGQQGQGSSNNDRRAEAQDPLGREPGLNGKAGTDDPLLQGEDVYRRARDLLDEIRRRSGEGERPNVELNYLKRLLKRF